MQHISKEKIPKKVLNSIYSYDHIPAIGYDGYYDEAETSFAKVTNSRGKVIGYLQFSAYLYSEDPEIHYWLFYYNQNGVMVETHNEAYAIRGDDFDFKGSTETWIKEGDLDI